MEIIDDDFYRSDKYDEEVIFGNQNQTYSQILRRAHELLLPSKKYAYDIVNECNMIKNAIKNLVASERPETEKYAILLQLAAEANLDIDARFSLWDIGSSVQDYYIDTCLSIDNDISTELALLWGKGVKQQVINKAVYCRSILQKIAQAYGYSYGVPRHVITILFDPEIGLIEKLEFDQRVNYMAIYFDIPPEETRRREEIRRHFDIHTAKMQASQIIVWKIESPDDYLDMYQNYDVNRDGVNISNYVSRDPQITNSEADFFRDFHTFNIQGIPFRFSRDAVMNRINRDMMTSIEEKIAYTKVNEVAPQLTPAETDFLLMVREKFLRGEYPIDMLWEDVCNQF